MGLLSIQEIKNYAESKSVCSNCEASNELKCPCREYEFIKSVADLCSDIMENKINCKKGE